MKIDIITHTDYNECVNIRSTYFHVVLIAVILSPAPLFSQDFTDVTDSAGVLHQIQGVPWGSGVAFEDFDGDGLLDLFCANGDGFPNLLYENNGNGFFSERGASSGIVDSNACTGAYFGDYDNDGDLDLYLTAWNEPNLLYRNNGNGTFSDVTSQAGVGYSGFSSSAAWGDYDNDGFLDLYVTTLTQPTPFPNILYHNNGDSTFTDLADSAGV